MNYSVNCGMVIMAAVVLSKTSGLVIILKTIHFNIAVKK